MFQLHIKLWKLWKQGKSKREGLEVNFDCKINTPYISRKANKDNCKKILEPANRK
jgi:hypothetical protein